MYKKVLIAGAGGYIGSKMVPFFLKKGFNVIALDRFYFGDTLEEFKDNKKLQIIKADIRNFDKAILKGVDVVINLASISNDPAADLNPKITNSINYIGAVRLAQFAKSMGVKKHIFASSCSVYGSGADLLDESAHPNPISEYAKSKTKAEKKILALSDKTFCVTVLRLATLYGVSTKRMRFDIMVNIMTLQAWKSNKIFVLGGGKQWRPLLHIDDCIDLFFLVTTCEKRLVEKEIFNVGSNTNNFQVHQVANMFKSVFPTLTVEDVPSDPDPRNYKVSFDKIKKVLQFTPQRDIITGIKEIQKSLEKGEIKESLTSSTLHYYKYLIEANTLLNSLKIKNKLF